jgi:predicted nuclease of predicted toxin-antitoxin system
MSKSSYRLLLDENVERRAMRYLEKRSHDAEMVVDVVEPQATDDEVQQYAEETNRLVLTSDQDFLARGYPILFQENDKMSAFEVAETVDAVAGTMSQSQLMQSGGTKLVEDWL